MRERERACECKRRRTMGSRFGSQTERENWETRFALLRSPVSALLLTRCLWKKSYLKQTLIFLHSFCFFFCLSHGYLKSGACFDHAYLWRKITLNFKQQAYNVMCLWCHSLEVGYLKPESSDKDPSVDSKAEQGPTVACCIKLCYILNLVYNDLHIIRYWCVFTHFLMMFVRQLK